MKKSIFILFTILLNSYFLKGSIMVGEMVTPSGDTIGYYESTWEKDKDIEPFAEIDFMQAIFDGDDLKENIYLDFFIDNSLRKRRFSIKQLFLITKYKSDSFATSGYSDRVYELFPSLDLIDKIYANRWICKLDADFLGRFLSTDSISVGIVIGLPDEGRVFPIVKVTLPNDMVKEWKVVYKAIQDIIKNIKNTRDEKLPFHEEGQEMKDNDNKLNHRIKNLTGGYVLIMKDGTVKFDLYPEEKGEKSKFG